MMGFTRWLSLSNYAVARMLVCAALVLAPVVAFAQGGSNGGDGLNTSDVAATALLGIGLLLLLLEIKLTSFGLLAILGTVCLLFGVGVMWQNDRALWGISAYYVIPLLLLILILTVSLSILAARAHTERVTSGREGFVGALATASEALAPEGRVWFEGSYWQAESGIPVAAGEKVRIIGVDGLKLYVEPAGMVTSPLLAQHDRNVGGADAGGAPV